MARRIAAVLFLLLALSCRRGEQHAAQASSYAGAPVIVISVDTLRADHLPAYGYKSIATPAIDALRRDGILYTDAWSHCPMTLPSHTTLLTGELPYANGVRNNIGYTFDSQKHDTIPAMLKRAGYATGAAVSAFVLRRETGLAEPFDFYDDAVGGANKAEIGEVARDGYQTEAIAEKWIGEHQSQPFFFFLHLFEPHWPYEGGYDAEIVKSDAIIGRFIEDLKASGIYDRALIVFLSDHGEGLGDHGEQEHGVFLYRETLHVPLIVKLPKSERAGTTVDQLVQLIDIAPTIATLTGATPKNALAGSSLLDVPKGERRIYGESLLPRIHFGWSELRSLVDAQYQFIDAPRVELYDRKADPAEKNNVASDQRRVLASMREAMSKFGAAYTAPVNIDPEDAEKLAALGYIGSARAETSGPLPDPKDHIAEVEDLKHGSALEKKGAIAEAAAQYESILARNPQFADAWLRLAGVQEMMGRPNDAVQSYRRAIQAAPVLAPQAALALGRLYLQLGNPSEAASHAELALRTQPAAAHHLLGRIALVRRDYATAEREARASMSDPQHRGPGSVLLARVLMQQGRLPEALTLLDEVRRTSSEPVKGLDTTRGEILALMNRAAESEEAFRTEIAAFPRDTEAYTRLAVLYFATGNPRESEATLQAMIAASPTPQTRRLAEEVRKTLR